ncbi:MAG TPA: molybdate ABC transporter substrate-binding protein [Planctomycetaceae bacterium]|jgi:molybdate transport system substrate-binding protein|nr:molybdate ABC transporter substrate-binding protein [Planctomycetaceae bacterium]
MIRFQFRETLGLSVLALTGLILLLVYSGRGSGPDGTPAETLVVYCAAGLQPPVSEILADYESANPVTFQTQFGGSGTLLSEIRVAGGDLFVAADMQYLLTARQMNLVGEILPIATQTPVIVVPQGNLKKIGSLQDLLKNGVRLSLADPKMAAIGKVVQGLLQQDALWDRLWQKSVIHRETVNQVANDVKLTAADAGIVWDATAVQYPALEIVRVAELERSKNEIAVGVLTAAKNPNGALRFAHYLTAPDKGLEIFRKHGYAVTNGLPAKAGLPSGSRK